MSTALSITWDESALERYREDVKRRADEWLAIHPNAKRRTEIREPEKAARALYLLDTTDMGQNRIAEEVGLAKREIGSLLFHRPEIWEKRRPRLAASLAATSEELVDLMGDKIAQLKADDEALAQTPIKDLALSIGIVADKAATFNGMATAVIEHRAGPSIDDARKAIEEARARIASKTKSGALEAEVICHATVEGPSDTQTAD